jgi:hypothetical protein
LSEPVLLTGSEWLSIDLYWFSISSSNYLNQLFKEHCLSEPVVLTGSEWLSPDALPVFPAGKGSEGTALASENKNIIRYLNQNIKQF